MIRLFDDVLSRIESWIRGNMKEGKDGVKIEFKMDRKCMNQQYDIYGRTKW